MVLLNNTQRKAVMNSMYMTILMAVGAILVLLVVFAMVFKSFWKVPGANEALIITGRKGSVPEGAAESMDFRISTRGTFVIPLLETCAKLSLNADTVEPHVSCPTGQGVQIGVKGVVIYKVGDDKVSIANAGRRFLELSQEEIQGQVERIFSGHLRSIVGGMTVEEIIQNREALASQTRSACATEIQSIGLIIDSLQIMEIDDPTKYIENIAAPHLARVRGQARIAQAQADQEATAAEQTAEMQKAQMVRDTELKKAEIAAQVEAKQAEAKQQGPLADARAQQAVLEQKSLLADREAELTERQLNATVRKQADAKAYETEVLADAAKHAAIAKAEAEAESARIKGQAAADATRAAGNAEADIITARGEAEGKALKAKAEGMKEGQDAVLAQMQVEQLPEVVKAAAGMYENVGSLTVLNGGEGMQQMVMGLASLGNQLLSMFKNAPSAPAPSANGNSPSTMVADGASK
jgi:flotillin